MRQVHKVPLLASFVFILLSFLSTLVWAQPKHFEGKGQVTSVDPIYSHVTIKHGAIKGFSEPTETEFLVSSPDLLKKLEKRDLVDFQIVDNKGNVEIDKIVKTGQAPQENEDLTVGKVLQEALVGTGNVVKGVTAPLAPANEIVSGAVDGTTQATGSALEDIGPNTKNKF